MNRFSTILGFFYLSQTRFFIEEFSIIKNKGEKWLLIIEKKLLRCGQYFY